MKLDWEWRVSRIVECHKVDTIESIVRLELRQLGILCLKDPMFTVIQSHS